MTGSNHGAREDAGRGPSLRAALELARVDLVRGRRWVAAQDFWLLYSAVSAAGMAFASWRAYLLGREAGVALAYVVAMASGEFLAVVERLAPVIRAPPLGWLADLSFATTAGVGTPAGAVGAVVAGALAVLAGSWLSTHTARYAWRTDRARPSSDGDAETRAPDHYVDRVLATVTRTPATRGVASTTLLRVARSPLQLVFVAFPLAAAIPMGEHVLATGPVPWYAPWLAVWYGAWAAGAAIPLNPLGNQGAGLPALLASPADARSVVHGYVVAAALVAAPVTAVAAVGLGAASGRAPVELVAVGAVAVAAVLAACVLAVGVGSVFPRFESVGFAGSRRALPPSKVAYSAFSVVLTATVVAAAAVTEPAVAELVAALLGARLPFVASVDADALVVVAWGVLAVAALGVPAAYRVGVERVRRYRLS